MARLEMAVNIDARFFGELRFAAVFVETRHGEPAVARNPGRIVHGDHAIGVARIADDQNADIFRRIFLNRLGLGRRKCCR